MMWKVLPTVGLVQAAVEGMANKLSIGEVFAKTTVVDQCLDQDGRAECCSKEYLSTPEEPGLARSAK
jgi:hypothetical protein